MFHDQGGTMQGGRYIGVHHGVKKLVSGKASPTLLTIIEGEEVRNYELATENEELDFVRGLFPTSYRKADEGENLSVFAPHHIKQRGDERIKVPAGYEGIHLGDTVAMMLGGSGDAFAEALARKAEEVGANFYRIAPFRLKEYRERYLYNKDVQESLVLAELVSHSPDLFQRITSRDIDLITVREIYRRRMNAMKDRMAAAHRLRQLAIGQSFRDAGLSPESTVEIAFERLKTTDPSFLAIQEDEKRLVKELDEAVKKLDIWPLFEQIEGVGPSIAARLISAIIDVKRFDSAAKLKRYCGVAVIDGKFMRRRSGETCGYSNDARQALYLLAEQFNRRPDSEWGKKLRQYKTNLRTAHPEVEIGENGKKRYTDAHIHKMGLWRTATRFVEWLYDEWMKIEVEAEEPLPIA